MGYLDADTIAAIQSVVSTQAEDWERNITIYRQANRSIISTDINSFNFAYGTDPQYGIIQNYSVASGTFPARIYWRDSLRLDKEKLLSDEIKEDVPDSLCRIKLRPEGFQFISGVDSILLDGILTQPLWNSPRPHGLFGVQFYDFYCVKIN